MWWFQIIFVPWGTTPYVPPTPPPETDDGWIWADESDHEWSSGPLATWTQDAFALETESGFVVTTESGDYVIPEA